MTKEEFIEGYCRRSNISRDQLLQREIVVPCACGDSLCLGWAVLSKDFDELDIQLATGITQ